MTGSSLAPIIIPFAVTPALFFWLFMVYYFDRHPGWRRHSAPGHDTPARTGPDSLLQADSSTRVLDHGAAGQDAAPGGRPSPLSSPPAGRSDERRPMARSDSRSGLALPVSPVQGGLIRHNATAVQADQQEWYANSQIANMRAGARRPHGTTGRCDDQLDSQAAGVRSLGLAG